MECPWKVSNSKETSESPEYNLEEAKIQMQPHQMGQALLTLLVGHDLVVMHRLIEMG